MTGGAPEGACGRWPDPLASVKSSAKASGSWDRAWKLLHTFDSVRGVRLAGLLPANIASVATFSPQPAAQSSDTNLCRIV